MSPLLDKMRWKFLDEGRNVNLAEQRGEKGFLFIPIGRSGTEFDKVISLLYWKFLISPIRNPENFTREMTIFENCPFWYYIIFLEFRIWNIFLLSNYSMDR